MRIVIASVLSSFLFACGGNSTSGGGVDAATDAAGSGAPDAPGGPTTVNVTLVNRPNNAATFGFLVAFQDGDGAWTLAPAPTGDTYALPIASGRYGVAWTCAATGNGGGGGAARDVVLGYFTVADRPSLTATIPDRCTDRITPVTLSGTVSNLGATGGRYTVRIGARTAIVTAGTGAYTIDVPPGTYDLVLTHAPAATIGGGADSVAEKALVQRAVDLSATKTMNLDFSKAVATQSFAVTIATTGGARGSTSTTLYTANATAAVLARDTTAPYASIALAAAQGVGTDVYDQSITVAGTGQSATTTDATATPGALTWSAPTPLGGALATVAATAPYPQIKATWSAYANAIGYQWAATQAQTGAACGGAPACATTWIADVSSAWLGSAASYQMPDLSKLAGWNAEFQYVTGAQVTGTVQAMTSSDGATDFPAGTPKAGTTRAFVSSDWTVTP
jgi:hypothetical protein